MRRSVWFLAAFVVAVLAYGGVWFVTATYVRSQALQWLDAQQGKSLAITHAPPTLGGFPLKAEVTFAQVAVQAPAIGQSPAWSWQTPAVRIYARPFVFNTFFLDVAGAHTLSGVTPDDIHLRIDEALTAFTLGKEGVSHAAMHIANADTDTALGSLSTADADVAVTAQNIHAEVDIRQATLPDVLPPPLTRTLQHFTLAMDITGPIVTGKPLPEVLEAWRAGGGTIEIRNFSAAWPPVTATGSGTLALDQALQPEGAFTATFQGFLDVVDMLVATQRMTPREASVARGALVLLATTPHEGAPPELKLSVTAQGGKAYAGPVTLTNLPHLAWPENVILP